MVCAYSTKMPTSFNCDDQDFVFSSVPASSAPSILTPSPVVPAYETTPILLRLLLDVDPTDVSWHIQTTGENPEILIENPKGDYQGTYSTYFEEIGVLRPDTVYDFVLFDDCVGGLNGMITIYLGSEPLEGKILATADLYDVGPFNRFDLRFNTSASATGLVSSLSPTDTPSTPPSQPGISPIQTFEYTWIFVRFRTYVDARTTGWRIVTASDEVVHEESPGFFRGHEPVFLKSLQVNDGESFKLVITDIEGLGFTGEAIVFIGQVMDENTVIAYYDGDLHGFFSQYEVPFTASINATVDAFPSPWEPTWAPIAPGTELPSPTVSPAPTSAPVTVVVTVFTDSFPLDTGWAISKTDGEVIVFVDTGSYGKQFSLYRRTVALSYDEFYVLSILDEVGDGMYGEILVYIGNVTEPRYLLASYDGMDSYDYMAPISFQVKLYDFLTTSQAATARPSSAMTAQSSFPSTNYLMTTNSPVPPALNPPRVPSPPAESPIEEPSAAETVEGKMMMTMTTTMVNMGMMMRTKKPKETQTGMMMMMDKNTKTGTMLMMMDKNTNTKMMMDKSTKTKMMM